MTVLLQSLPHGTRFTYPDAYDEYAITRPASEHRGGWVEATNLSMTDERAQFLIDQGCKGDPRETAFAMPLDVEVLR